MTFWVPRLYRHNASFDFLFQSLFYWNDLLSAYIAATLTPSDRFQSLFYWNDLLSGRSEHALERGDRVSILVLLEWPSELHLPGWGCERRERGFNPCSIGMTFWVHLRSIARSSIRGFNPCSIGMTFWVTVVHDCIIARISEKFQSLFYWNDLLSRMRRDVRQLRQRGFNPCSIGMTFWVCDQTVSTQRDLPRFNPCSIGMTFWVKRARAGNVDWKQFQSLFYWNDLLSASSTCRIMRFGRGFQSLFYWNDLLSPAVAALCMGQRGFQSLFYWNDLLSLGLYLRDHRHLIGFNPCSIGMTFWVQ